MRDPAFWWAERSAAATLLEPVAACYGAIAARRMARVGSRAGVPVVCVGNFTVGGAGKTPTAMALARLLLAAGRRPFFLSRGYGGRLAGPVRIDRQGADEVGDEPLLLARIAPTIVSRDRLAGAIAATDGGAEVIIMDDGLQNPSLVKDLAIAVVDGRRGIGNGRVFPAGPLRAPLEAQLGHVHAVLVIGAAERSADSAVAAARKRGLAVLHGELRPDPDAAKALAAWPVLAFAGIADPGKFFATLERCGIRIAAQVPFPDHHRFTPSEIAALVGRAEREGLALVTTEKDMVRISGDAAARTLMGRAAVLPVSLVFWEEAAVDTLLRAL
jgi:tetraacyldisaccharide 4'-kinase